MIKKQKFSTSIAILALSSLMVSCAGTTVPISDFTKDKSVFVKQYFSPQSIPEAVFKKIPFEENNTNLAEVKFSMTSNVVGNSNKELTRKNLTTFTPLGNGLVQVLTEYSTNDIPTNYSMALSFKGIFDVRWNEAMVSEYTTRFPREMKSVSAWDKLSTNIGDKSTVTFKSGSVIQIVDYQDGKTVCTTVKAMPASTLHKKLTGNAFEVACEIYANGLISYRTKFAYVEALKFAIPTEVVNSNYKETITVDDVTGL